MLHEHLRRITVFSEALLLNSIDHRVVVNRPPGFIVNTNLREPCFLVGAKSFPEPREEYQHQKLNLKELNRLGTRNKKSFTVYSGTEEPSHGNVVPFSRPGRNFAGQANFGSCE
jgi:hypothetical protein